MYQLALLYLATFLAGFGLTNLAEISFITDSVASFFEIVGAIVMIVFALALTHLGLRALFTHHFK
ncbi:hypothetical protein J2Z83_000509 [Virgibacillus natechei]|uniref:Uncharacterized protein n=1 Tax=Virgibacillus natechei TaxID=1216297 RepID=A0ABS4IBV4_9BACI|nr:hypothetical protein [Virgibacillus natechei]MBP1968417.1 hypothetical protein [Virgibacillus natechei]UZD13540.1 hypothetical protein OLD84_02995 [Virgibacillus natechei]